MRHARDDALDRLEPLLVRLRAVPGLVERKRGNFTYRSKAMLHFHEDPAGLFADLRPPGAADFTRIDVTEPAGQDEVVARVAAAVDGRPQPAG